MHDKQLLKEATVATDMIRMPSHLKRTEKAQRDVVADLGTDASSRVYRRTPSSQLLTSFQLCPRAAYEGIEIGW